MESPYHFWEHYFCLCWLEDSSRSKHDFVRYNHMFSLCYVLQSCTREFDPQDYRKVIFRYSALGRYPGTACTMSQHAGCNKNDIPMVLRGIRSLGWQTVCKPSKRVLFVLGRDNYTLSQAEVFRLIFDAMDTNSPKLGTKFLQRPKTCLPKIWAWVSNWQLQDSRNYIICFLCIWRKKNEQ